MAATVTWRCTANNAELTIAVTGPTAARANELALTLVQAYVAERARALDWAPMTVQLIQL